MALRICSDIQSGVKQSQQWQFPLLVFVHDKPKDGTSPAGRSPRGVAGLYEARPHGAQRFCTTFDFSHSSLAGDGWAQKSALETTLKESSLGSVTVLHFIEAGSPAHELFVAAVSDSRHVVPRLHLFPPSQRDLSNVVIHGTSLCPVKICEMIRVALRVPTPAKVSDALREFMDELEVMNAVSRQQHESEIGAINALPSSNVSSPSAEHCAQPHTVGGSVSPAPNGLHFIALHGLEKKKVILTSPGMTLRTIWQQVFQSFEREAEAAGAERSLRRSTQFELCVESKPAEITVRSAEEASKMNIHNLPHNTVVRVVVTGGGAPPSASAAHFNPLRHPNDAAASDAKRPDTRESTTENNNNSHHNKNDTNSSSLNNNNNNNNTNTAAAGDTKEKSRGEWAGAQVGAGGAGGARTEAEARARAGDGAGAGAEARTGAGAGAGAEAEARTGGARAGAEAEARTGAGAGAEGGGAITLRCLLPDGGTCVLGGLDPAAATLAADVRGPVAAALGHGAFCLAQPYPPRRFTDAEESRALCDIGLRSSSALRVMPTNRAETEKAETGKTETGGLFGIVSSILSQVRGNATATSAAPHAVSAHDASAVGGRNIFMNASGGGHTSNAHNSAQGKRTAGGGRMRTMAEIRAAEEEEERRAALKALAQEQSGDSNRRKKANRYYGGNTTEFLGKSDSEENGDEEDPHGGERGDAADFAKKNK